MKIEMGESLMLSWLRHYKKCKITQLNWKPSSQWQSYNEEAVLELFKKMEQQYPVFKNSNYEQLIKQAELDVVGINSDGEEPYIYAIDVAYHEGGLNYGSKEETINRITKKMLRSALVLLSYFNVRNGEIIFSSPKINPAIYDDLNNRINEINKFMKDLNFNYSFELYANTKFTQQILNPIILLSNNIDDTSELFMRAIQLNNLCEKATDKRIYTCTTINKSRSKDNNYSNQPKIGELVKNKLNYLFEHNLIPEDEIIRLKNADYCKKVFDLNYALLIDKTQSRNGKDGRPRYWSPIFGNKYYACNDWYERHRLKFENWLNKFNN